MRIFAYIQIENLKARWKCESFPMRQVDGCILVTMKHVYAESCRTNRHPEDLGGLLMSRGRATTQISNVQSFSMVSADPQEVPSTG
jgi:hypothetical protein